MIDGIRNRLSLCKIFDNASTRSREESYTSPAATSRSIRLHRSWLQLKRDGVGSRVRGRLLPAYGSSPASPIQEKRKPELRPDRTRPYFIYPTRRRPLAITIFIQHTESRSTPLRDLGLPQLLIEGPSPSIANARLSIGSHAIRSGFHVHRPPRGRIINLHVQKPTAFARLAVTKNRLIRAGVFTFDTGEVQVLPQPCHQRH